MRRVELEAAARPARLAYADPPYIGLARKYYGAEPTFAGEVDHGELLDRLATYDGWALSCSSASVPAIAALLVARDVAARLAVWVRNPVPHPTAAIVTAWEGVFVVSARFSRDASRAATRDVLLEHPGGSRRDTLPGAVIGMKPPAFATWVFELLGATPGDTLDDLYPGSGIVARAWEQWTGAPAFAPAWSTLWHPATGRAVAPVDASDG